MSRSAPEHPLIHTAKCDCLYNDLAEHGCSRKLELYTFPGCPSDHLQFRFHDDSSVGYHTMILSPYAAYHLSLALADWADPLLTPSEKWALHSGQESQP